MKISIEDAHLQTDKHAVLHKKIQLSTFSTDYFFPYTNLMKMHKTPMEFRQKNQCI